MYEGGQTVGHEMKLVEVFKKCSDSRPIIELEISSKDLFR